jgi:NTE family protein
MASREEKAHTPPWVRARMAARARRHTSAPGRPLAPRERSAGALTSRRAIAPSVVLAVASAAVFMAFLDDSVVAIAFPDILRSFPGASVAELSWVFNAYNIAFAALLVPAGVIADLLGRRRLFLLGVVLFSASSALCAGAPAIWVLIAARAFQGMGAALLVPASLALVLQAHARGRRAQAVSAWAATAAVAAGFGPSIGGLLVDAYDWRLVFLVNVPIGLLVLFLVSRELVESRAPGRREVPDLGGALLLAAAVSALTLALTQGPVWGWSSPAVIVAALGALAGGFVFARRSRERAAPLLDRELVHAPRFGVTAFVTAIGSAGFFALGLANVLFLMDVWRYSALVTGLALTPAPFVAAPTAMLAGRLAARGDSRRLIALGALVLTTGAGMLLARMTRTPDFLGAYLPAAILLAIGIGVAFPLVSDAAVSSAPGNRYAGASALHTAIRLIGGAIGVAILAALLGKSFGGALPLTPFRQAWGFAGIAFAVVALVAFRLPRSTGALVEELAETPIGTEAAPTSVHRRRPRERRAPAPVAPPQQRSDENLLGSVAIFAGLSDELRHSLAGRAREVHLAAGDWLFCHGEQADGMYVLRSGRLEVFLERAGGKPERIRELGAGSAVGELALLSAAPRSASLRCRRDAELIFLERTAFEELMQSAQGFATGVSEALAAQLQQSVAIDTEPTSRTTTVALLALTARAAAAGAQPLVARELDRLCRVEVLDRARAIESHRDAPPGIALSRALDRLEEDHELVLLDAAGHGDGEWERACIEQADRVLLLLCDPEASDPPADATALERLGGCDVVLLGDPESPATRRLVERLEPRSTHRVAPATFAEDVARLARRLAGRSVGLVLSGGGARALAHIGAIEELLAAGIVIDRVGGTSMGAFIGALLAQGMDGAQIDARCYEDWVRRNPLADYGVPRHSLLRGARLRTLLERTLPGLIESLRLPYYCTAVDAVANELVVYRRGELAPAVTASMAVPGVLPPLVRDGRLLFDGAVLDGLPVSIMAGDAEGPVIACDVTKRGLRETAPGEAPRVPSLMSTLANLAFLATSDTSEQAHSHADLVIAPEPEDVGALEFHMIDSMRAAGRRAALDALEHAPPELFA